MACHLSESYLDYPVNGCVQDIRDSKCIETSRCFYP
jgi:hypothetical protein